ncbi:unnamed protein product, partial [marine sediment metagenome]
MFKKKTEKKSEEKVKPSNQEVQRVLAKAKKVAEKKEKANLAKKLDLVLKKVGKIDTIEKTLKKTREKTDRLEALLSGKDTEGQKKQT